RLFALALAAAATLGLALAASRRLARPLAQLTGAAEAIARREFGLPAPQPGTGDEIGRLSLALAETREWVEEALGEAQAAREEAERERRTLEAVLEAMPVGVTILEGAHARIVRANPAAEVVFGQPLPPGTSLLEFHRRAPILDEQGRPLPPERLPGLTALAGERSPITEIRLADGRGGTRLIRVHAAPIPRDAGAPPRAIVLYEDVTERALLRTRLTHTERLSALGRLVAGVAHELNNPLTSIIGFGELLLAQPAAEDAAGRERRAKLEMIVREATRAARIVRNLLTFARPHGGERAPGDLRALVARTLELRAHQLRKEGIEVELDLPEDLPPVYADHQQLQQVLLNLLLNAEQALTGNGAGGPRRISIRGRRAGAALRLEIEDTGPGIPAEHRSRVFDPFFTTKPVGAGTGLGLSVSHGIVEAHGGRIWAEPAATGGARLVVELPIGGPGGDATWPAPGP
ncbi:MAG TPA: ATP-binding protein, partial [Thermodesulfobacteriota bacterium]|nr:ATP-binding protein [Thermodesulfobacteriota bacterium]